jgi:hypothetical protein
MVTSSESMMNTGRVSHVRHDLTMPWMRALQSLSILGISMWPRFSQVGLMCPVVPHLKHLDDPKGAVPGESGRWPVDLSGTLLPWACFQAAIAAV